MGRGFEGIEEPAPAFSAARVARTHLLTVLMALTLLASCTYRRFQAEFTEPSADAIPEKSEEKRFLKAHLRDGGVVVFDDWSVDTTAEQILGQGLRYDATRDLQSEGLQRVAFDQIVLVETNHPENVPRASFAVLGVATVISLTVTAICLANPKACFGSCPTFYVESPRGDRLVAEGFSASVARVLEETDVDAMPDIGPRRGHVRVHMANEALETHAVRGVRLLAVEHEPGTRVYRADESFHRLSDLRAPSSCRVDEASCGDLLRRSDSEEYQSPADAENLAAREVLELDFPAGEGRRGLVIVARNTLLNTFLFYQVLAYMGTRAGELLARIERQDPRIVKAIGGVGRLLGDIDVHVKTSDGWTRAGAFSEVGPIARDAQLILLPEDLPPGPVQVRIEMTKGNWRLDQVALGEIDAIVEAVPVPIARVERDGRYDAGAQHLLLEPSAHLMTYPDDRYDLDFQLPPGEYELFLESTGFYYEWMRESWLREEDADALRRVLTDPEAALRDLAPRYKAVEPHMDAIFWKSRLSRP